MFFYSTPTVWYKSYSRDNKNNGIFLNFSSDNIIIKTHKENSTVFPFVIIVYPKKQHTHLHTFPLSPNICSVVEMTGKFHIYLFTLATNLKWKKNKNKIRSQPLNLISFTQWNRRDRKADFKKVNHFFIKTRFYLKWN